MAIGSRSSGSATWSATGTAARWASARSACSRPRSLRTAGCSPRARSRSSARPARSSSSAAESRRARVVGQLAVRREPHLQSQRDRDEPLLGTVVEIALDVAACAVGSVEDARARRADLGQLRLDDLALAQRLLRRAAGGHVEDRAVEPAAAVAGRLCVPTLEHPATVPSRRTIRYSSENGRPVGHRLHDRRATCSRSSGCSMLGERAHARCR